MTVRKERLDLVNFKRQSIGFFVKSRKLCFSYQLSRCRGRFRSRFPFELKVMGFQSTYYFGHFLKLIKINISIYLLFSIMRIKNLQLMFF